MHAGPRCCIVVLVWADFQAAVQASHDDSQLTVSYARFLFGLLDIREVISAARVPECGPRPSA